MYKKLPVLHYLLKSKYIIIKYLVKGGFYYFMLLKLTYYGLIAGVIVLIISKLFEIILVWKNKDDLRTEKISQTFSIIATFIIELIVIVAASLFTIKNFLL